MILPVIQPLKYISPTTLNILLECEYATYLLKMAGNDIPKEPTNEQIALGTCFDAHAKNAINIAYDGAKNVTLGKMLKDLPEDMEHMIAFGKAVYDTYEYYGCMEELLQLGVKAVELEVEKTFYNDDGSVAFVIFGYPDAVLDNGNPLDWKVSGWGSSNNRSPAPGYISYRVSGKGSDISFSDKGKHNAYGIPLEDINIRWARQLLLYNWCVSEYAPNIRYRAIVDQIIMQSDGRIGVARYDTHISEEFNVLTYNQCKDLWNRMNKGHIHDPTPNIWKCEPFKKPRPCTVACAHYSKTLGDPMMRELFLNK